MEGSSPDGAERPPFCDGRVLRYFAGCLWRMRKDAGVGVRCFVLEILGRVVGWKKGGVEDIDCKFSVFVRA